MQEIVLILSSIAGVATAAAVRKIPRDKNQLLSLGASSHIKNQINSLKIEKDILRIKVLTEDIEHSLNIRDPKALLAGMSSDIQQQEGTNEVIIRGSRPGDAIYYIDGVKANDMSSVPGVAVQGLEAYTGGIPAKYGDTTGGVVVLETKGYFDLYYAWKARN